MKIIISHKYVRKDCFVTEGAERRSYEYIDKGLLTGIVSFESKASNKSARLSIKRLFTVLFGLLRYYLKGARFLRA